MGDGPGVGDCVAFAKVVSEFVGRGKRVAEGTVVGTVDFDGAGDAAISSTTPTTGDRLRFWERVFTVGLDREIPG